MVVVVVAAIIRSIRMRKSGKCVTHVSHEKKNSHVCSSILHFYLASFTCLLAIGFDIHTMLATRGKMREARYQNLWDMIVNNDDISFKHINSRLNSNDLKFLYGVNTETRKLIKRSSRKKELKKGFDVKKMSSISTLEFAWEHFPWGGTYNHGMAEELMDEKYFSSRVALTNKLELLKWAREEKKCEWDEDTINEAASHGNLEMVKYCVANKCHIDEWACAYAAYKGHLECLKYLREEAKAPWDSLVLDFARTYKHLECLRYAVEKKCPGWSNFLNTEKLKGLEQAAGVGDDDVDRGVSFSSRLYHLYVVFFFVVLLFFIFVFLDVDVWAHRDGEQSQ